MTTTIKDLILQDYKGKLRIVCLESKDAFKNEEDYLKALTFKIGQNIDRPYEISQYENGVLIDTYAFLVGAIVETIDEENPTLKEGMFITFNYDNVVRVGIVLRDNSNDSLYVNSISKEYIESFDIDIFDKIEWKEVKL